jgi:hypothetical protein
VSEYARTNCLICGSKLLQPLCAVSEQGVPHGIAGHNFVCSYSTISGCQDCGHGQLEKFSHDCWSYDEDWDMYWWYGLSPTEVIHLQNRLKKCPAWQQSTCDCAVHQDLRASSERLWGGVKHAVFAWEKTSFAWIRLEETGDKIILQLDEQRGVTQAT